jgi:hypothetical protein
MSKHNKLHLQTVRTWLAPSLVYPKPARFLQSSNDVDPAGARRFLVQALQGALIRPYVSLATPYVSAGQGRVALNSAKLSGSKLMPQPALMSAAAAGRAAEEFEQLAAASAGESGREAASNAGQCTRVNNKQTPVHGETASR